MHSPQLRNSELCFPSLGWNISILYLESFCIGDLSVFSYLFISVWTHEFIVCVTILFCLFCCSNYFSFGSCNSVGSCVPLTKLHCCGAFFLSTLISGTIRCSRVILYVSCSSPRIKELCSFYWRMVVDTKIWAEVCSLLLGHHNF